MKKNIHSKLADQVISQIHRENIKPKSVWYFVVLSSLIILLSACVMLFCIYIANLVGVMSKTHEYLRLVDHGWFGVKLLLRSLPFVLLLGFITAFVLLIVVLNKCSSMYRVSLPRLIFAVLSLITIIGIMLVRADTSLNFLRLNGIESKNLKAFHNHYFEGRQGHIVHGDIISIDNDVLTVKLLGGKEEKVFVSSLTKGMNINMQKLPLPVFILVDSNDKGMQALYIGLPENK